MLKTIIKIGTRRSILALRQAEIVVSRIKDIEPQLSCITVPIITAGDINIKTRASINSTGIFTKELEASLLKKEIDLAVHSLKDVPVNISDKLLLAAVLERADPRDVFISNSGYLKEIASDTVIYTGSERRKAQLHNYRPDLIVQNIRGNIDTRLQKISELASAGLIIAAAGLIRTGLQKRITEYLSTEYFLPSPGQGTIVVQTRKDDKLITELCSKINHRETWNCVYAERQFLKSLGGGCRSPVAALASYDGKRIRLDGMICDAKTKSLTRAHLEGGYESYEQLGIDLAKCIIKRQLGQTQEQ